MEIPRINKVILSYLSLSFIFRYDQTLWRNISMKMINLLTNLFQVRGSGNGRILLLPPLPAEGLSQVWKLMESFLLSPAEMRDIAFRLISIQLLDNVITIGKWRMREAGSQSSEKI